MYIDGYWMWYVILNLAFDLGVNIVRLGFLRLPQHCLRIKK